MKRKTTAVGASLIFLVSFVCGLAFADLKGSVHDFSSPKWKGVDQCGVCHMPQTKEAVPPLWDTRVDLSRRFGKMSMRKADPGMGTLACLRCHDGTIAKDATGAAIRDIDYPTMASPLRFGMGHGRSDHPVGVEYPQFDPEYRPTTFVLAGWKVTLPDGKVECSSCHDPHAFSGEKYLLRMSNSGSALCLTCHKK